MKKYLRWWGRVLLAVGLGIGSAQAEDIDVFVGSAGADSGLPNVIFVLDNTANWSRQSQQWPGGLAQGQSEARALNTALAGLIGEVNVGLIEFTTDGSAGQDGGYVRFNLQKLTTASQLTLSNILVNGDDSIFKNVESPVEKRSANTPYGNLMYDVYNYLAGRPQSYQGEGTPGTLADSAAYSSKYGQFRSPLTSESLCVDTYLIFIGNPNTSGPTADSGTNSEVLRALYAAVEAESDALAGTVSGTPLPIPSFNLVTKTEPGTLLGNSAQCYTDADVGACTAAESLKGGLCDGKSSCYCSLDSKKTSGCVTQGGVDKRTAKLGVFQGGGTVTEVIPSGTSNTSIGRAWNFDDWAKFFNIHGVPVTTTSDGQEVTQRVKIKTYTIDVFNKQQNAEHTGLMLSAAAVGGGGYFAARNEDSIVEAITQTLSDILSVSSTFAAVTLPLSATNRAQQENQVFIGMFRPDRSSAPRWFGNLKRYQISLFNGRPELADANRKQAINPLSGFAAECAESFWTTDSAAYWADLGIDPAPMSRCLNLPEGRSEWSDLPDGPFVEKGGVAQKSRESDLSARNLLTVGSTGLTGLTTGNASALGGTTVLNYLRGTQVGVGEVAPEEGGRPSIHGDVIHARPLTINYGGNQGIHVYYGANDGLFRSVRAADGGEQWSLIVPEHFGKIKRLYDNEPYVAFPNTLPPKGKTAEAKSYFFDGAIGQLVRYNDSNRVDLAYIYPTMRRGGRMVYGLDVTSPSDPSLLWRVGCTSDTSCSNDFGDIGQTWSTPMAASLGGYTESDSQVPRPVVMFGGGYDTCLDNDRAAYSCGETAKGRGVYVLDAEDGSLLRKLATDEPVVADLATVDMNFDGLIDFAYAADAAGNLYRIDFASLAADGSLTALPRDNWSITKVAATLDSSRRFLNAPSVAVFQSSVYVALGSGNRERPLESNYPYVDSVEDRFYVFADFPGEASSEVVDLDGSLLLDVTQAAPGVDVECNARGERGWYMGMPGRGEQVVNPAAIAGGQVLFNSYRPGTPSVGMCTRPLGIATAYRMSLFSPSACDVDRGTEIVGGGMPIPPVITTVPVTDPDGNNEQLVTVCIGCEGLKVNEIEPETDQTRRRIYWNTDIDR